MTRPPETLPSRGSIRRTNLKKLLVALGLSSALILTPALAQTDQNAPAGGAPAASAPAADAMAKPKAHHHKKAKHVAKKSKKAKEKAPDAAPADPNAPKT